MSRGERAGPQGRAPYTVSPPPDGAKGARVVLPPGTSHAVITGAGLRAVDVEADAALVELDCSGCAPGLFITLQGTTAIERVRVPEQGAGANLFMVLGALTTPLRVHGLVQMLDATCLDEHGGRAAFRVETSRPAAGAWMGTGHDRPPQDVGVLVAVGGTLDAAWSDEARGAEVLSYQRCRAPEGIHVGRALHQVFFREVECASLRFASAASARLEGCATLERLEGHVGHLVIRGGAKVKKLTFEGHLQEALLDGIECAELDIPAAQRLLLRGRHRVKTVTTLNPEMVLNVEGSWAPRVAGAKTRVRPLTPADIERAFVGGSRASREGMLAWAKACRRPSELWLALQVLSSALDTGEPADSLWAARCKLGPPGAGRAWEWNFPGDLAVRGWSADVRLWLRCVAAEVPAALEFGRVLGRAHQPAQLAALLVVAAAKDVSAGERDLLLELALFALGEGAAAGERLDLLPDRAGRLVFSGLKAVDADWLELAFRSLLELHAHPQAPPLATAWAGWTLKRLPNVEGIHLLGQLAVHGCEQARTNLSLMRDALAGRPELNDRRIAELGRAITHVQLHPSAPPTWGVTS